MQNVIVFVEHPVNTAYLLFYRKIVQKGKYLPGKMKKTSPAKEEHAFLKKSLVDVESGTNCCHNSHTAKQIKRSK